MGLTQGKNIISGSHSGATEAEITIGDGSISNGEYNVTDFADFNATFNTALSSLTTGGIIRLLSGEYTLTADIQIEDSGVSVIGVGNVTVNTGRFSFNVYDTTAGTMVAVPQISATQPELHLTFENLTNKGTAGGSAVYTNTTDGTRQDTWGYHGEGSYSTYCAPFDNASGELSHVNSGGAYLPQSALDSFTISACVYSMPSDDASVRAIVAQRSAPSTDGGITLYKDDTTNKFALGIFDGSSGSPSVVMLINTVNSFPDFQWQHVVVSYDGSNTQAGVKFWVDGVPQEVEYANSGDPFFGVTDTGLLNPNNTLIGADIEPSNDANWWRGYIDYVSIWDSLEPTDAEVETIYSNITNGISNVIFDNINFTSQNGASVKCGSYDGNNSKVENSFVTRSIFNKDTSANPYDTGITGTSLDTDLEYLYLLDETSGTAAVNEKGANGILGGTPVRVTSNTGVVKPSYDGATAYRIFSATNNIDTNTTSAIPITAGLLDPFSISMWVKSLDDSSGQIENFVSQGVFPGGGAGVDYFSFYRWDDQDLAFTAYDGSKYISMRTTYKVSVLSGWVNIAVTYDGTNTAQGLKMYADGIPLELDFDDLVAADNTGLVSFAPAGNVVIGSNNSPGNFFRGMISNTAIWHRKLSPKEIYEYYLLGASKDIAKYNTGDIIANTNISNMDDSEL